jgi:hypothetical protein
MGGEVGNISFSKNGIDWTHYDVSVDFTPPPAGFGPSSKRSIIEYNLIAIKDRAIMTVGESIFSSGPTGPHTRATHLTRLLASTDYQNWTELPAAPWAKTAVKPAIAGNDAGDVFAIGGMNTQTDVWVSKDNLQTWTKLATGVCGKPRSYASAVWFSGKLWLIGGVDNSANNLADIWSSPDGITWKKHAAPSGWAGQPSPTPVVYNGKLCLFMSANIKASGSEPLALWRMDANEVWTLDTPIPNAKSLPTTSVEGIPLGVYNGAFFADFSTGPPYTKSQTITGLWMRNT